MYSMGYCCLTPHVRLKIGGVVGQELVVVLTRVIIEKVELSHRDCDGDTPTPNRGGLSVFQVEGEVQVPIIKLFLNR